jgi:hypothetical protein
LKAVVYFWMGMVLPLTQAFALRSFVGGLSMAIMLVVSITRWRRLFFLCGRLGLLPAGATQTGDGLRIVERRLLSRAASRWGFGQPVPDLPN